MGPFALLRHPLIFTGITVPEFLHWYVFFVPGNILRSYMAYLRAFVEIFSFVFLVRTLFSPWRQIVDPYPSNGFNLSRMTQAFTMNTVSRTIGFLFRSITLFVGLFFVILLTCVFAMYYMLWLSFPILFWIGVSYLFSALA